MTQTSTGQTVHFGVEVFDLSPAVVRCNCGDAVVCERPGMWKEHLATGAHGKPFPWPTEVTA